jgi:hypothetical protein
VRQRRGRRRTRRVAAAAVRPVHGGQFVPVQPADVARAVRRPAGGDADLRRARVLRRHAHVLAHLHARSQRLPRLQRRARRHLRHHHDRRCAVDPADRDGHRRRDRRRVGRSDRVRPAPGDLRRPAGRARPRRLRRRGRDCDRPGRDADRVRGRDHQRRRWPRRVLRPPGPDPAPVGAHRCAPAFVVATASGAVWLGQWQAVSSPEPGFGAHALWVTPIDPTGAIGAPARVTTMRSPIAVQAACAASVSGCS